MSGHLGELLGRTYNLLYRSSQTFYRGETLLPITTSTIVIQLQYYSNTFEYTDTNQQIYKLKHKYIIKRNIPKYLLFISKSFICVYLLRSYPFVYKQEKGLKESTFIFKQKRNSTFITRFNNIVKASALFALTIYLQEDYKKVIV